MLFIYTCSIYFMVLLTFFIMFRLNTRVLDRLAKIKIHSMKKGASISLFSTIFRYSPWSRIYEFSSNEYIILISRKKEEKN